MLARNVPAYFLDKYAAEASVAGLELKAHVSDRVNDWSFSAEWNSFFANDVKRTWGWDIGTRERMFLDETGLSDSSLGGMVVLDAGCGNGQLTNAIGARSAICIGFDYSESVFLAESRRTSSRTHFVQGDLNSPPFDARAFDLVYSSGVLHHNRDTRSSFASVAKLVREGGRFYCWLYWVDKSPKAFFFFMVTEIIRPFASRSPKVVRDLVVKAWAAAIYAVYRLIGRRKYSFEELVVGSYDVLTPRYAWRHTPAQVARWFYDNGFGAPTLTHWDNPNGFGMVATRGMRDRTPGIHYQGNALTS
jgi:SAM-dependent methyltransferase